MICEIYMNIPKLRGKIKEAGFTYQKLASALGISVPKLHRHLKMPDTMPYLIIKGLTQVLALTADEQDSIFWAKKFF